MNSVSASKSDLAGSFFRVDIAGSLFFCILLTYVLFGLDIATTTMILSLGGFEANHVMVPVVENVLLHLIIKGFVLILVAATAQWADMKIRGAGLFLLLVVIGWYSIVVVNNASVLIMLCGGNCPIPFGP